MQSPCGASGNGGAVFSVVVISGRRDWLFFFVFFAFSRAAPMACGGSQARGPIGVAAAGLRQSHSNAQSEPRLQPTPQLMATPDP